MAKKNIPSSKPIAPSNTTNASAPKTQVNFRMMKQLLITAVACVIIVILPALPRHVKLMDRVKQYYEEAKKLAQTSETDLMSSRHGENFVIPKEIEKMIQGKTNEIFLLPPKEYILYTHKARKQIPNPNNWSNPYIFYYFSDKIRTCKYDNDTLRKKATLALRFDERVNNWGVVPIKNDTILENLLVEYKKK